MSDLDFMLTGSVRPKRHKVHREFSTGVWKDVEERWKLQGEPSTIRQYAAALRRFEEFCAANGFVAQPGRPDAVAGFLAHRRDNDRVLVSSLRADANAIRQGHLACGLSDPTNDPIVYALLGRQYRGEQVLPAVTNDRASFDDTLTTGLEPYRMRRPVGRPPSSGLPLEVIDEVTVRFKLHSLAKNTREAYAYALRAFVAFCDEHKLNPLPASAETVARFLTDYGLSRGTSSLGVARAAIRWVHRMNKLPSPTEHPDIEELIKGHRRELGKKANKKHAFTTEEIVAMCVAMDRRGGLMAIRDKAMLTTGFGGAFRRSELTHRDRHDDKEMGQHALEIRDLEFNRHGVKITVRKSKTDQDAEGQEIFIVYGEKKETCPVLALQCWLEALKAKGIERGPVFRALYPVGDPLVGDASISPEPINPKTMVARLKYWAERIGLDPKTIGGHSLRAGHVTAAINGKASLFGIVKQGRWRSFNTVLEYYRSETLHEDNSSEHLGL